MAKLTMQSPTGQPTNNQLKRDRSFKTKPIDAKGKQWVRDTSYPVNTWVLRKIKK